MKAPLHNLTLLALTSAAFATDETHEIQHLRLDPGKVHTIPVSQNRTTTVSFPDAIAAIDGAFMSLQPNQPGLFQLAHTQGTSFFSVRCLAEKKEARTNLNVRWENQTYVLLLQQSEDPGLSVVFQRPPETVGRKEKERPLTPAVLLGLLDNAKAHPFLKEHHPEAIADVLHVDHRKNPPTNMLDGFEIRIEEVFRFDRQDTLVFHLSLRNPGKEEILYRPDSFSVTTGDLTFPQSISDASGVMKPGTETTVYLAITGTPSGGRNDLSPENQFTVSVALQPEDRLPAEIEIHPSK